MSTSSHSASRAQSWDPGPAPTFIEGRRRASAWRRVAALTSGVVFSVLAASAVAVLVLMAAGIQPRVEATGSMAPMLHPGDLVFVREVPAHEARVGDVVAFREAAGRRRVIVHRATAIQRMPGGRFAFTTKGDANDASEQWFIATDGRMGVMSFHVPFAGQILDPFRGIPWGLLPLLATLALGVLAVRWIWRSG